MTTTTNALEAAKLEFPAASPVCTIKQRVGLTDIEIVYSRPSVKGRTIFGELIPYGQVWRTGANAVTKIVFSTPVTLNGSAIPAGTYALMSIPGKEEWTIILNQGAEQWGAYKYDEKTDLVRLKVAPKILDKSLDTFTIEFDEIRDESAQMNIAWEKTLISIKLEVDYVEALTKQIEEVMASKQEGKPYFQSALFFCNHDKDLKQAQKWADQAVADREAFFTVFLKARILAKLGDKAGAIAASKQSLELATQANDTNYMKQNENLLKSLE